MQGIPPSTGGFDPSLWFTNNVASNTVGSVTITPNQVLQTRESTPGGGDNAYGYTSTLRGTFPWGATVGTPLPPNIGTISLSANFLLRQLLSGSRYHIFIALYYRCSAGINGWFDTQVRAVNVGGVDQPVGHTETYLPGDSSGWAIVPVVLAPGDTWNLVNWDVENQFAQAAQAYNVSPTTPHTLDGIEIGTEGFNIQEIDVDWPTVGFNGGPANALSGSTFSTNYLARALRRNIMS